jgi:hypothetical protein
MASEGSARSQADLPAEAEWRGHPSRGSRRRHPDVVGSARRTAPDRPVAVPGDGAAARRSRALKKGFAVDAAFWTELNIPGSPGILTDARWRSISLFEHRIVPKTGVRFSVRCSSRQSRSKGRHS